MGGLNWYLLRFGLILLKNDIVGQVTTAAADGNYRITDYLAVVC